MNTVLWYKSMLIIWSKTKINSKKKDSLDPEYVDKKQQ